MDDGNVICSSALLQCYRFLAVDGHPPSADQAKCAFWWRILQARSCLSSWRKHEIDLAEKILGLDQPFRPRCLRCSYPFVNHWWDLACSIVCSPDHRPFREMLDYNWFNHWRRQFSWARKNAWQRTLGRWGCSHKRRVDWVLVLLAGLNVEYIFVPSTQRWTRQEGMERWRKRMDPGKVQR